MKIATVAEAPIPAALTPAVFATEFASRGEPRVFRNLVSDWPALKWTFPDLVPHLPDRPLRGSGADDYGLTARGHELRREGISKLLSSSDDGADGARVDWLFDLIGELPELLPDMPPPAVAPSTFRYRMFLGRNTASHGHYHSYQHALLCQVHGTKRIRLHPPADIRVLYPDPLTRETHGGGSSAVDFDRPDLTRFPKMSRSHPFEAVLGPGDALFIPIHWWHAVYGTGATLSVSLFWLARLREYRFPQPGLRALAARLRWDMFPRLRAVQGRFG